MKKEKIEKAVWVGEFEGHSIKVVNNIKAKLYIDGEEAAKEKGLINFSTQLRAEIPGTDYIVIANVDGAKDVIIHCDVMVAKKVELTFGKESESGQFTAYTEEEIKKMKENGEAEVATMAMITTIL